jgi:hypothetical protein
LLMDTSLYRREPVRAITRFSSSVAAVLWAARLRRRFSRASHPPSLKLRRGRQRSGYRRVISDFASAAASVYDGRMLELEVYAAGVRDLNKILELDIELETIPGLHYKVDRNHDIVYLELEGPTVTFREIRSIFRKLGLEPKFVGAIPAELRPKTKTQLIGL